MGVLKVSADTDFRKLAAALAHFLRRDRKALLRAAGPRACYTVIKALLVARGLTAPEGSDLRFVPRANRQDGLSVLEFEVSWR